MTTGRLEAFSDGVLAIIITIMVMQLKVPDQASFAALWSATGVGLLSYVLSFVYVGIYWNNHHHLLQSVDTLTGGALWANLNLLFWLSLMPFTTAWMDESRFARVPVFCYGLVLLLAGFSYMLLQHTLVSAQPPDSPARRALRLRSFGTSRKDKLSLGLYAAGIVGVLVGGAGVWVSLGCYVAVAVIWFIPDRRLESAVRG